MLRQWEYCHVQHFLATPFGQEHVGALRYFANPNVITLSQEADIYSAITWLGEHGWELVGHQDSYERQDNYHTITYTFKRPKTPEGGVT